jgi:hypothetical protein
MVCALALLPPIACAARRDVETAVEDVFQDVSAMQVYATLFAAEHKRPPANLDEVETVAAKYELPFDRSHWRAYSLGQAVNARTVIRFETANGGSGWFDAPFEAQLPAERQLEEARAALARARR